MHCAPYQKPFFTIVPGEPEHRPTWRPRSLDLRDLWSSHKFMAPFTALRKLHLALSDCFFACGSTWGGPGYGECARETVRFLDLNTGLLLTGPQLDMACTWEWQQWGRVINMFDFDYELRFMIDNDTGLDLPELAKRKKAFLHGISSPLLILEWLLSVCSLAQKCISTESTPVCSVAFSKTWRAVRLFPAPSLSSSGPESGRGADYAIGIITDPVQDLASDSGDSVDLDSWELLTISHNAAIQRGSRLGKAETCCKARRLQDHHSSRLVLAALPSPSDAASASQTCTSTIPPRTNAKQSSQTKEYAALSTPCRKSDSTCQTTSVFGGDFCASMAQECGLRIVEFTTLHSHDNEFYSCVLPDIVAKPRKDGSCFVYTIKKDDGCFSIAVSRGITCNKKTWGWSGCKLLNEKAQICLSTGTPSCPVSVSNAVCGPQVVGTSVKNLHPHAIIRGSPLTKTARIAYYEFWYPNHKCLHMNVDQIDTTKYTHLHFAFAPGTFNILREEPPKLQNELLSRGMLMPLSNSTTLTASMSTGNSLAMMLTHICKKASDFPGIPSGDADFGKDYYETLIAPKSARDRSKSISGVLFGVNIDYVVYMTYDLHSQWDHNNWWASLSCPTGNCLRSHVNITETTDALSMITKAGVPSSKVVVGIASYERSSKMGRAGCTGPTSHSTTAMKRSSRFLRSTPSSRSRFRSMPSWATDTPVISSHDERRRSALAAPVASLPTVLGIATIQTTARMALARISRHVQPFIGMELMGSHWYNTVVPNVTYTLHDSDGFCEAFSTLAGAGLSHESWSRAANERRWHEVEDAAKVGSIKTKLDQVDKARGGSCKL
ncbi:hypothetical protein CCMA1212_003490 [Trichoderma ghanense]|uniref:GH18 domain-containing protein n=1 Tax=Trichoderma ghanense TaxID=65468 RepID=A0ABY2H9X8_9HYPO